MVLNLKSTCSVIVIGALSVWSLSRWLAADASQPAGSAASGEGMDLDRIERAAFAYGWQQREGRSGLVYNTTEDHAPASPTAIGVALSGIPIGVERGWINREQGYQRAQELLSALKKIERVRGFFYHFVDPRSGKRMWKSEVSGVDSAILFMGAIVVAAYFPQTDVAEAANRLVENAQWDWLLNGEDTLKWAWRPETGFDGQMDFSESILAYLLALGSPTHPIPPFCWDAMRRPVIRLPQPVGESHAMVYTADGSLFAYLLPMAWIDLRNRHDAYLDYWTNARTAILSNIQFCWNHREEFRTYREGLWGLSASLGPDGYKAYGAMPALQAEHDGTVAPYAVAASIPWIPDVAMAAYRRMELLAPELRTPYGLGDAVNLDRGYACRHTIALDQGLVLLMIENARTGMIWRLVMRHPMIQQGLARAGFVPGSLDDPVPQHAVPGNPGDRVVVPFMDRAVTIDADLHEWIRREALTLTPSRRRNVEFGYVRSSRDASGLIYLGWNEQMLYLAGIITDDEMVTRRRGADIYQDDCLELFVDSDGDGFRFDGNPNDVQIGLAPGGPDGSWHLWAWGALKRRPDVPAAVTRQPGGYLFEVGLPMTLLRLTPGTPVRFSVAIHDRDTDGKAAKLHWSVDATSIPGALLFGTLTLQDRTDPSGSVVDPAHE